MLLALKALKDGDFSARLPEGPTAIGRQLAKAFNEVAELNASLAREVENVSAAVKNNQGTRRRAKIRGAKVRRSGTGVAFEHLVEARQIGEANVIRHLGDGGVAF